MSSPPTAEARPEKPPWMVVLSQVEEELAGWLARAESLCAAGEAAPAPGRPAAGPGPIDAALARAGEVSRQTDASLGEVAGELARWSERAAELRRRLSEGRAGAI